MDGVCYRISSISVCYSGVSPSAACVFTGSFDAPPQQECKVKMGHSIMGSVEKELFDVFQGTVRFVHGVPGIVTGHATNLLHELRTTTCDLSFTTSVPVKRVIERMVQAVEVDGKMFPLIETEGFHVGRGFTVQGPTSCLEAMTYVSKECDRLLAPLPDGRITVRGEGENDLSQIKVSRAMNITQRQVRKKRGGDGTKALRIDIDVDCVLSRHNGVHVEKISDLVTPHVGIWRTEMHDVIGQPDKGRGVHEQDLIAPLVEHDDEVVPRRPVIGFKTFLMPFVHIGDRLSVMDKDHFIVEVTHRWSLRIGAFTELITVG